jgi:hypothetical protein
MQCLYDEPDVVFEKLLAVVLLVGTDSCDEQARDNGRDRDRTDDLYRVKVALIPTELRAREN